MCSRLGRGKGQFDKVNLRSDDRYGLKPVGLCDVGPWVQMCGSHGCSSPVTPCNPMTNATTSDSEIEALVQKLTNEIMANLGKK